MSRLERAAQTLPLGMRRWLKRNQALNRLRHTLQGRPSGPQAPIGAPRPVVYLPTWLRWDVMKQRPQHLLAALAGAGHEVWFVDPRLPRSEERDGVRLVPTLDPVPQAGVILYVHYPPVRSSFELFDNRVVIYDVLDDHTIYQAGDRWEPPGRRAAEHHVQLLYEADLVIASHPALAAHNHDYREDILLIPNGVNLLDFERSHPWPSDLAPDDAERPVVGYQGAVGPWFDFALLEGVAELLPEWRFVVVGPVDPEVAVQADKLELLPNVTLLGQRPPEEIPAYVKAFDVGAIWFTIDRLTEAVSPLKLYEYLAGGIPVVSTPLPEARSHPLVRIGATPTEFVSALWEAVDDRGPTAVSQRREAAAAADWSRRIELIISALDRSELLRVQPK